LSARAPAGGEDEAAIRAFLSRRDDASFLVLYRRHAPYLYRLALRLLGGGRGEAEDAVQETWLRAVPRLGEFRGDAALRTWLAGFTINCCRELLRTAPAEPPPALRAAAAGGVGVDLERAIAELPQGYREVLVLHDLEGYTHEQIAERLRISAGTSKSQLSRARRALREKMA
jgi:DNA-directed RNA polymerase specialized sigma24 family protein